MIKPSFWLMLPAVLILILVPASRARADNLYGSIRGLVKDQAGATMAGAAVTVTDVNTGISRLENSAANGSFEFLNLLAPSAYDVAIEKNGFQKYRSIQIHLHVNQVYVVNAALQVGSTTQEITVRAPAAQIDTTTMQLGTTITGKQIVDIPLNGRDWVQLQQLQPGVMGAADRFTDDYATDGAESQQNSFLISGVDTNDLPLNTDSIVPSPDAIGEFRMITNTINPEYGRNSGAILNATIKNGGNQFHGDAFDFYRETSLDARNFFQQTVSPFHRNQFGGTIGGPVWKNHTFFFFSYQGEREAEPQAYSVPTVYSAAERTGNFSAMTGGAFPLINSSTGAPAVSPVPMLGANGVKYPAGTPYAALFPAGVIPQSDLNPLAVKLMNQFVPLPNAPANTYEFNPTQSALDDQYITRIDENFGTKDTLWGLWIWERHPFNDALPYAGADLPGFEETNLLHQQEYALDWTHTISPTSLNEARLGYFRFNYDAVVPTNPVNPTSYGFTGLFPQFPSQASLPVMSVTGLFTLGFSADGPQPRIDQTYDLSDNFAKIAGRHTLKLGFEMERFEVYNPFLTNLSGNFSYSGIGSFSTGYPGIDFLLGLPDSYVQQSGNINDMRAQEYYSYAQDEFKLRPNLTLTFGTGWDIETPYWNLYDNHEQVVAFRPGQQSTVFPTAPTGLLYPGDRGINDAGGPTTHLTDFAPRAGFAWSPGSSQKWSLRGGFGIYYNRTAEEGAVQNLFDPPFLQNSRGVGDIGGSPAFSTPFSGWCPGAAGAAPTPCSEPNKFPFTPPPIGSKSVNFSQFEPLSLNVLSPNFGVPMSENYNLTLERQLTPSMILQIGYVANVGRHLEGAQNLQYAGRAPGLNPGAVALNCNFFNLGFCDPSSFSLYRQYGSSYTPAVFGDFGQQSTDYNSNYNSLQASVNKQFSHGLNFLAAYTWSRYFDYTSNLENNAFNAPGIDPFNWHDMYGPSAFDAPQRFVLSYGYTLPIHHFVRRLPPLTDGWRLTGITTFQSGFPVGLMDSADPSLVSWAYSYYLAPDRPNAAPGVPLTTGNPRTYNINGVPNYWFNPSAFAKATPGTGIGNVGRDSIYGPGLNNWDIGLLKDIHITESKYFELRLETFNTFNHTQFTGTGVQGYNPGGVVSDVNNPEFGRVIAANPARILQLAGKFYF